MRSALSEALAYVVIGSPAVALIAGTFATAYYIHPLAAIVPAIPAFYISLLTADILFYAWGE